MFKLIEAFSGFSVDDIDKAKEFYCNKLGFTFNENMGGIRLQLKNDTEVWIYQKDNHQPATYTMLNFIVDDIDDALKELEDAGVTFERYSEMPQDDKGIMRGKSKNMGPDIAWFKDPAGNILSILEE